MKKVEQRQIWEVVKEGFLVNPSSTGLGKKHPRKVVMEVGEKIEIRYPYEWHFRAVDNSYFQAEEEDILKHCKFFGRVWEEVAFQNIAELGDIIKLKLYHDPKQWARKCEKS